MGFELRRSFILVVGACQLATGQFFQGSILDPSLNVPVTTLPPENPAPSPSSSGSNFGDMFSNGFSSFRNKFDSLLGEAKDVASSQAQAMRQPSSSSQVPFLSPPSPSPSSALLPSLEDDAQSSLKWLDQAAEPRLSDSAPSPAVLIGSSSPSPAPPVSPGTGLLGVEANGILGSVQAVVPKEDTSIKGFLKEVLGSHASGAASSDSSPSFWDSLMNLQINKTIEELAATAALIVVILLLIKYRDKVLILLTEDDRIHTDVLDTFNFCCFKSCGLRCFHCPDWCCWQRCAGWSPLQPIASHLGFGGCLIEVSNIVVGDLPPWRGYIAGTFSGTSRPADYYLEFRTGSSPPQATAVAEAKMNKRIHFPEKIILKIRDNPLEEMVYVKVQRLHFLGSYEVCEQAFNAQTIIDWAEKARPEEELKRFQMRPFVTEELETPPWFMCRFKMAHASDERSLHNFNDFGTNSVRLGQRETKRLITKTGGTRNDWNELIPMAEFKQEYILVDADGNPKMETKEVNLDRMRRLRTCLNIVDWTIVLIVIIYVFIMGTFFLYSESCYKSYLSISIAQGAWKKKESLHDHFPFPMSLEDMSVWLEACEMRTKGTGIEYGTHYCRPTVEQLLGDCKSLPPGQPQPTAFRPFLEWLQSFDSRYHFAWGRGIPCECQTCRYEVDISATTGIVTWSAIGVLAVLIFLATFGIRLLRNGIMNCMKLRIHEEEGREYMGLRTPTLSAPSGMR